MEKEYLAYRDGETKIHIYQKFYTMFKHFFMSKEKDF